MNLERVLEPEVMDSPQEAEDYNAMDHSEVNRVFVSDLVNFAGSREKRLGDVLDLGTGTALIPIELCRQESDCRIMAIDMSVNNFPAGDYVTCKTPAQPQGHHIETSSCILYCE